MNLIPDLATMSFGDFNFKQFETKMNIVVRADLGFADE